MKNSELFNPGCPAEHAKKLVKAYALRGLLDNCGAYKWDKLLAMQNAVYTEWLAAVRASTTSFNCDFYEWLGCDCDSAFVFRPGDLVKHDGHYCVVVRRHPSGVDWANSWHLRNGIVVKETWPQPLRTVELKDADGHVSVENALAENIEPTDFPPEVFALACRKAKDCPILKGGSDGE